MAITDKLRDFLEDYNGVITNKQAQEIGISRERLRLLVKSGELERVAAGVFMSVDAMPDRMYVEQLRKPRIIYSHETALFLDGMTDRDPIQYSVTVPRGYNTVVLLKSGFTVYSVKHDLYELGLTQVQTMFGHAVTAYNPERTICDCIRSRNQMDVAVVTEAVKRHASRKDKDLNALMRMADTFRVTKLLCNYL